jgi:tRNA G10  N-methylase Trm11
MKYLFALGRDGDLAKLEIISILKQTEFDYSLEAEAQNYLIIDLKEKINIDALMSRLAGTVRIAEVIGEVGKVEEFDFEKSDLYLPNKLNYLIHSLDGDGNIENDLDMAFKKFCRQFKIRAVSKNSDKEIAAPDAYRSWRLDEGMELLCANAKGQNIDMQNLQNKIYIAHSITSPDPDIFQMKDNDRPARKFTHGTSFRLAQMMVNILDTPFTETVVDPFCGTGTFLIEGMIKGYNMIGIDIEQSLINASEQNINWARKKFHLQAECKLICGDSIKENFKAEGCIFEPYMGEFLKKAPGVDKAKESMKKLENFYSQIFSNLAKNLKAGAKVVCILPYLTTYDEKKVYLSNEFFARLPFKHSDLKKDFGLDMKNPIEYSTPSGSLINRQVHILKAR